MIKSDNNSYERKTTSSSDKITKHKLRRQRYQAQAANSSEVMLREVRLKKRHRRWVHSRMYTWLERAGTVTQPYLTYLALSLLCQPISSMRRNKGETSCADVMLFESGVMHRAYYPGSRNVRLAVFNSNVQAVTYAGRCCTSVLPPHLLIAPFIQR